MIKYTDGDFLESEDEKIQIKPGDLIQNRFLIVELIGEGSFGQVYKTYDQKNSNQLLAIKLEDMDEEGVMLEREIKVLIELKRKVGFPSIKFYGQEKGYIYCIMTMLGKNLDTIFKKCGNTLSIPTILKIAIQILNRIETFHQARFIHRDIKPDNFVLGANNQISVIHLIDFGLSKYYLNNKGEHIPHVKKAGLIGTARYASVNAHEEMEQSRKDDLESIGYVLIYLATGSLPWMNLQIEQKQLKYAKIHQIKKNTKYEVLCQNMPKCFIDYMNKVKSLQFTEQPNYHDLRSFFQEEFDKNYSKQQPFQYDWEKFPEYQQKRKHQTVHIMQSYDQKFEQQKKVDDIKIDQVQERDNKTKNRSIMIDVVEEKKVELAEPSKEYAASPQIVRQKQQRVTYLQPQKKSDFIEQKGKEEEASNATKKNHYEKSESIGSEGGALPIWGRQSNDNQNIMRGLQKKASIIKQGQRQDESNYEYLLMMIERNSKKSKRGTFVQPEQKINGDDDDLCEDF